MVNRATKMWISSSPDTLPGWLEHEHRNSISSAYGREIGEEAWEQIRKIVDRFAWLLGDEQHALSLTDARARVDDVVLATSTLREKIQAANGSEMDSAATKMASRFWQADDALSNYDIAIQTVRNKLAATTSEDFGSEIMATVRACFPRPSPAADLDSILGHYNAAMRQVSGEMQSVERFGVAEGEALDALIVEVTDWATAREGFPVTASESYGRSSPFVCLIQHILELAPAEHRPKTLLDASMAQRIRRARKAHRKRLNIKGREP